MAKKIFIKNNTANSSPQNISISPNANIEDYVGTDRFGIYVHGTKGGYNDLPTEGCFHGDAWIINQRIVMWSATEDQWVELGILAGVQGPEGPEGPQGVEGPEGKEGPMGPQGNDGYEGPPGPPGERGPQGPAGLGLYIMGNIDSESDLASKCVSRPGQTWFLNGDAFVWTGEAFENIGKIQGPEGAEGKQGPQGERGETGDRGEPGQQGARGEQGPRGPQGIKGDSGEKGDQGDSVTLVVREVHKSEPGAMPEINISNLEGKPPIQYIDFTIPQGEKGPVGPIGPPNYMEVIGVSTLPSDQPARVEITNEVTYGLKLLDPQDNEWLLDVDIYGKLFTEPLTAQNNVPGSAMSYVEINSDEILTEEGIPTGSTNKWYLYLNEDGKIILDDGKDEEPEPEPEPEEGDGEQPLKVRNNKLIRVVNDKNPLMLTAPNKTVWRVGVTQDTNQLYTINADNEIITSESYIHQKISFFIPQGVQGERGDRGPQGPINLIEAGTIETLEEHEDAYFEIEQLDIENLPEEIPEVDTVYIKDENGEVHQVTIGDNERLTTVAIPVDSPVDENLIYDFLIFKNAGLFCKVTINADGKICTESVLPTEDILEIAKEDVTLKNENANSRNTGYFKVRISENGRLESENIILSSESDIIARVTQRLNLKIPRGKKGDKGDVGRSNRIQIVDVFTLPNEEPASAELSEPFLDRDPRFTIQELILKLPRGEKGDQGWSIDYKWEGTVLFIKREDEEDWGEGVDLKGEKGDSVTFEGGIIVGDTTFDGRMDFVNSMYFDHEKLIGLTNFNDDIAFGFKNLIAKNSLQIGYQRNDDYECINPQYHPDGELCDTDPPEPNKYDKYPAVINLHTMNGESYITKQLDNTLEFSGDGNINFITPDVQHNGLTLANKPYVDAEIESLRDYVGDTVGGVDGSIREYVDQQDDIVRSEMSALISSSVSNLNTTLRTFISSEDSKTLQLSKDYTNSKDTQMKTYVDGQITLTRNYVVAEDNKVKTYVNSEDQRYLQLSKDYTDQRLEDLDITGSFAEYIRTEDEKYLQLSKDYTDERLEALDVLGSVTDYVRAEDEKYLQLSKDYTDQRLQELDIIGSITEYVNQEDEKYLQLSKDYTDAAKVSMTTYTNMVVEDLDFSIKMYINNRDVYYANINNEKFSSVNNKIDNAVVSLETQIEETNLYLYSELLEVNSTISQNYVTLTNKINDSLTEAKNYTDAEILSLDIPTFKLDVANSFNAVDERNTIDEQNLHDTNLFMVENFAIVNQMIEDLENRVQEFVNVTDDNGVAWAIKVDTSGRIKTMRKTEAVSKGIIEQKPSPIVDKLIMQIIQLEERIKQLEKK